jgi:hypothetical protein
MNNHYRLCFVEDTAWAYFTNVEPREVWGDDWNDAPHDCNAGTPYTREGQDIYMVAFTGDFEMGGTRADVGAGYLSVEQINAQAGPWLKAFPFTPDKQFHIWAGVTLDDFRRQVQRAGGQVFEPVIDPEPSVGVVSEGDPTS